MKTTKQDIIAIIQPYLASQPVDKAWLFGSYARGEQHKNSDVDILVKFSKQGRVSLFKHLLIQQQLEELIQRPVDLVTDGTLLPFALKTANRDKILIYERGK